jgi:hypothetical protein
MRLPLPGSVWLRIAVLLALAAGAVAMLIWRGPAWDEVADAFRLVDWPWVVAAIGLNLASVVARVLAWETVIRQAMPPPRPGFRPVFSAFGVGLFANAVLPGRVGELARVAVLTRRVPRRGAWATLVGTVFAHRVFDVVPVVLLVGYVLATAKIPHWAITSLTIALAVGVGLFVFAFVSARRHHSTQVLDLGPMRRLVTMARIGLGVMHTPSAAALAIVFQCFGWLFQLLAVYTAMRAFQIHAPLPAAAVVLLLMNVATIFPLWPGNIGLVQAAIALPLIRYGVAYPHGVAFGFGLQAIEASVGIGIGLFFLAREGLSYAMLKVMPDARQAEELEEEALAEEAEETARARARVPG